MVVEESSGLGDIHDPVLFLRSGAVCQHLLLQEVDEFVWVVHPVLLLDSHEGIRSSLQFLIHYRRLQLREHLVPLARHGRVSVNYFFHLTIVHVEVLCWDDHEVPLVLVQVLAYQVNLLWSRPIPVVLLLYLGLHLVEHHVKQILSVLFIVVRPVID